MSYELAEKNMMMCSKTYANWLLEKGKEDGLENPSWLDLALRYCNAGYEETLDEEMKKANDFYWVITFEGDAPVYTSSYETVMLYAPDPADREHMRVVDDHYDSYSVITTGAAFPGKQQFPEYMKFSWDLKAMITECCLRGKSTDEVVDTYRFDEFQRAGRYLFIDNRPPFSYGPGCPDRNLAFISYVRCLREAVKAAGRLCCERGIEKEYNELYHVILAWELMGNKEVEASLAAMLADADQQYEKQVASAREENVDLEEKCKKIHTFTITNVRAEMEPYSLDEMDAEQLTTLLGEALKHRDSALDDYMSPREVVSKMEEAYPESCFVDDIVEEDEE